MWDLRDDDPPERPPMRDASGEPVDMGALTEQVIADEVAKRLRSTRRGRVAEYAPPEPERPVQAPKSQPAPVAPPMPNGDVVALVLRLAAGGKYVRVDRLLEELR